MFKRVCQPKTPHDIHKSLCAKPIKPRSKYELVGPADRYRDENWEIYRAKCEEFKMKAKMIRDENIKAMTHHRPKLGEVYKYPADMEDEIGDLVNESGVNVVNRDKENKVKMQESLSSIVTVKETGTALRKRHERYYNERWNKNDKLCNYEPWFRRYLILCRFIVAVRKVILKNRLLKNLDKLRKVTKDEIELYESQYVKIQQLSYPEVFKKFMK